MGINLHEFVRKQREAAEIRAANRKVIFPENKIKPKEEKKEVKSEKREHKSSFGFSKFSKSKVQSRQLIKSSQPTIRI